MDGNATANMTSEKTNSIMANTKTIVRVRSSIANPCLFQTLVYMLANVAGF